LEVGVATKTEVGTEKFAESHHEVIMSDDRVIERISLCTLAAEI